jgi:hypothetical protein
MVHACWTTGAPDHQQRTTAIDTLPTIAPSLQIIRGGSCGYDAYARVVILIENSGCFLGTVAETSSESRPIWIHLPCVIKAPFENALKSKVISKEFDGWIAIATDSHSPPTCSEERRQLEP